MVSLWPGCALAAFAARSQNQGSDRSACIDDHGAIAPMQASGRASIDLRPKLGVVLTSIIFLDVP